MFSPKFFHFPRVFGCEDSISLGELIFYALDSSISVPTPPCYKKVREELIRLVEEGAYLLGELIEPKTFRRFVIGQDGEITTEIFEVEGRKISLVDVRERIFQEHKRLGNFFNF